MALVSWPYYSLYWPYQGIDYAYIGTVTQQLADDMAADGIRFVARYLYSSKYPNGKGISAAEAQIYLDAGLSIFLYYEVNTSDALSGYSQGVINGRNAAQLAADLGYPSGCPIICCCDTSVTDTQAYGVVMDYLEGFAEQLGGYSAGIYGGTNVMEAAGQTWPDELRVQAGAWGNQEYDDLFVRQWYIPRNRDAADQGYIGIRNVVIDSSGYATWRGHSVDLCSAPDLSLMWGGTIPPPPPPPPPPPGPTPETGPMPIWFYLKRF